VPCTLMMNHQTKFDAVSFIFGGEIRNRTYTQKNKQTSTSVVGNGRISTHADSNFTRRAISRVARALTEL